MTDAWDDDAWEADDGPDRADVQRLARQLAEQRARQRANDLAELDELKRMLRERAAEVAAREAEVERAWAEIHGREGDDTARRRILRLRRERPAEAEQNTSRVEVLAAREGALVRRAAELTARERELARERDNLERLHADASRTSDELATRASDAEAAEQELASERKRLEAMQSDLQARQALTARDPSPTEHQVDAAGPQRLSRHDADLEGRQAALRVLETRIAAREADVVRMQTALAAREEELRRRERELDDSQRLHERAARIQLEPYLSFSEGLDSLAERSRRRGP